MGSLFARMLSLNHQVTMLDPRREIVDAIAAHGVALDGGEPVPVRATSDPAELFESDALFFFVKAYDTLAAARPFAGNLNPAAAIVSLQNGLGNEEAIKTALGGNVALVLGVTNESAESHSAGRSRRTAHGTTVLGSAGASQPTTRSVAELLESSEIPASVVYDIRPHLWGRLVATAAINPIAALLETTVDVIVRDTDAAALAREVVREAAAVARASRISLPLGDAWAYVREVAQAGGDGRGSMSADLAACRPTEVDEINGAIVAAGRRAQVATPYNEALVRLIKAKEALCSAT